MTAEKAAHAASILGHSSFDTFSSSAPWAVFPRKRLEISAEDYRYGLYKSMTSKESERDELMTKLERFWAPEGGGFACLSVRTGFDLYLRALNLPRGSEILMSAVTIKDMVKICEHHGLIPIALDMEEDKLTISAKQVERAISSKTKLLIFAHIFGTISDLSEISTVCKRHGVKMIEDCAEAYAGPIYRGCASSDVTLFSFGTIKTSTSLGGCLMRVLDQDVLGKMKEMNNEYTPRPRHVFTKRLIKYGLYNLVSSPVLFGLAVSVMQSVGADYDEIITRNSRGFPAEGEAFYELIRHRPCVPLLALLHRRLHTFDESYLQARRKIGEKAAQFFRTISGIRIPGSNAHAHYYWLFPVIIEEGLSLEYICARLLEKGFDVTPGATQLSCISNYVSPEVLETERFQTFYPKNMSKMMQRVLYLPLQPLMPSWSIRLLLRSLVQIIDNARNMESKEGENKFSFGDDDDDSDDFEWNEESGWREDTIGMKAKL
eukprot:g494.t1